MKPVSEFLLIPFGQVRVDRPIAGHDYVFTRAHAAAALRWFAGIGRKLAIDYEHQTFDELNTRGDGLRPAAGWIGRMETRTDGLWACGVEWTAKARAMLTEGEYRYFSPVIYWTDEEYNDVAGLGPVALTNDPAMASVQALAATRLRPRPIGAGEGKSTTITLTGATSMDAIAEALGLPAGASEEEILAAIAALQEKAQAGEAEAVAAATRQQLGTIADQLELGEVADASTLIAAVRTRLGGPAEEIGKLREQVTGLLKQVGEVTADNREHAWGAFERTYSDRLAPAMKPPIKTIFERDPTQARELVETMPKLVGNKSVLDENGQQSSATADRGAIIAKAKRDFDEERATKVMLCSQRTWVDQALRDAGKTTLTDDEVAKHDVTE